MISAMQAVRGRVTALVGEADLGSGETVESEELPVDLLGSVP